VFSTRGFFDKPTAEKEEPGGGSKQLGDSGQSKAKSPFCLSVALNAGAGFRKL
jgi:hypothetical protein